MRNVLIALLLCGLLVGVVSADTAAFTSSDSWDVPAGVYSIDVIVVGGGAGGGSGAMHFVSCGRPPYYILGGGGGGGGSGYKTEGNSVSVTPGQTLTITVGTGGSGGAAASSSAGNDGSDGGQTSITGEGVSVTANGGTKGTGAYNYNKGTGGAGGNAGSNGSDGLCYAGGYRGPGGSGGAAIYSTYGAGGAGGLGGTDTIYGAAGAAGGAGYVLITYTPAATPPVAAFSADVTEGTAPLTVTFTDSSTNDPTSWAWDIDNDGDTDYTTQNCEHTYTLAGTYSVKLTATNGDGSDDEVKTDYITVNAAPTPTPTTSASATLSPHVHYTTFPTPPAGYGVTTYPAEGVTCSAATLKCNIDTGSEVWFEYGFSSGNYNYATTRQTCSAGNCTEEVSGIPLTANQTVYYRAVTPYGYGEEQNFTTLALGATAFPTSTYSIYVTQFFETEGNWTAMAELIWEPYIAKFGTLFFSILIGVIFIGLAAKQGSSFIPLLVVFIIGIPIFVMLAPEFLWLAQALIILGVGITIYYILTQPR